MITQILIHTPLWVYGLFLVLVAFGLQQTRSRKVTAVLAYILPFGMMALSLAGLNSSFGMTPAPLAMWTIGLLTVTVIGFKYFRDDRVSFIRSSRSFHIPGSWTPLIVILAIFFTKYGVAVTHAVDAALVTTKVFVAALSLAYGGFSGYFSSRAVNLMTTARAA